VCSGEQITQTDLFDLHRAVTHQVAVDAMNPVGNWKRDFNGTTGVKDGKTACQHSCYARWISSGCRSLPISITGCLKCLAGLDPVFFQLFDFSLQAGLRAHQVRHL